MSEKCPSNGVLSYSQLLTRVARVLAVISSGFPANSGSRTAVRSGSGEDSCSTARPVLQQFSLSLTLDLEKLFLAPGRRKIYKKDLLKL
jgi:hypothetical protein